ncbi:hypothetical protein [Candidatus Nitrosocosmicus arcticus]|uniref:Uncharacterized protein n=1 Tax=Candidatus Nitrosocosmicus arcticus TaxID=2035267 RepID=A0A557SZF3_9ARCH|nr:hypothetical protein [Candidatus Nitrosocosmicus arcticus]TVP41981.1 exported protein of unknown function [Candidatus Nitrosocosmicus arcticus]
MNKYTFFLLVPIVIALSMISISANLSQNVIASPSQTFCPPICLDEVQQHVNDAREALNDGNVVVASSELDIVDSLLDQLDDMTSKSD